MAVLSVEQCLVHKVLYSHLFESCISSFALVYFFVPTCLCDSMKIKHYPFGESLGRKILRL